MAAVEATPTLRSTLGIAAGNNTNTNDEPTPLFSLPSAANSPTHRFRQHINVKYGLSLQSYDDLYRWSTSEFDAFWSQVWDWTDVVGHKGNHVVAKAALPPDNPAWFSEASLNWAENMLRCRSSEKTALVEASTFPPFPPSESRFRKMVDIHSV